MATPGFCGKPAAPPVQTTHDEQHADLVGHRFPVDTGGLGTVLGTWRLNPAYVDVATDAGPTLRVAAQVRRGRELMHQ